MTLITNRIFNDCAVIREAFSVFALADETPLTLLSDETS